MYKKLLNVTAIDSHCIARVIHDRVCDAYQGI